MDDRETLRSGYPLTIPDTLLHSDAMQRACAARDFQEIFRLVNRRTGSSYATIATAIGMMTTSRVSDVIRGARGIRGQAVIERVADGFGIPGELLGLPRRPWEGSEKSCAEAVDDVSQGHGAHSEQGPHAQYTWKSSSGLDLVSVAELRQKLHHLDERYLSVSSTALIAEVGHHLGQLSHWHGCSVSYAVRRDLLAAQAEAATLMGQLVWDASGRRDRATARVYFEQAIESAQQLRDPVAEGLALLRASFVELYGEKNPESGLRLAQQTATTANGASHVLTGLAVLHSAEAHAMAGAQRECEQALSEAKTHLSHVDESDAAASLFSPSQFGRMAGSCYLFLGDAPRAQAALEATARDFRDGSKPHAIVLGNLALSHIRQRKVDEALAVLHRAIDVVERHRGGGGLNIIFQAGRELRPWRDVHAVHDVNDRLMALMSAT